LRLRLFLDIFPVPLFGWRWLDGASAGRPFLLVQNIDGKG
jgi:hypothetical protein